MRCFSNDVSSRDNWSLQTISQYWHARYWFYMILSDSYLARIAIRRILPACHHIPPTNALAWSIWQGGTHTLPQPTLVLLPHVLYIHHFVRFIILPLWHPLLHIIILLQLSSLPMHVWNGDPNGPMIREWDPANIMHSDWCRSGIIEFAFTVDSPHHTPKVMNTESESVMERKFLGDCKVNLQIIAFIFL